MKTKLIVVLVALLALSCASKKEIIYLQDVDQYADKAINYNATLIQPNDILKIKVETLVPEASIPYNKSANLAASLTNIGLLQLEGYLVSIEKTIKFPILGQISVENLTITQLEEKIAAALVDGGHLINPSVNIRLLNAKVTILGEVNQPGTYSFTENNITLIQALGYANDLTINGKRDDILVMREENGIRKTSHIDLTKASWLDSPYYFIKPNDVIVVNPNHAKVKSAGFIGSAGTILTIASLVLSTVILLTR
jgi:polysaccharide export outer membrane protein